MAAGDQTSLWDAARRLREGRVVVANRVGPFKIRPDEATIRYFDCQNYDRCLGFAALSLWSNYTCEGCRRSDGKSVEE